MAYAVEDARQLGKCMKIVLRDGTRKNVNQQAVARRKICNAYRLVGVMRGLRMAKDYDETKSFTNSSTSYVQYCLPIIRCFMIRFSGEENPRNFYLTKEVLNVLKNLRENQNIGITVETEEMRKLGIVYLMNEEELKKILRNFEISKNEFTIIKIEISYSFNKIATPFISSYGTFIKLSTDAFDDVLRYISQNMQLFQNIKQSDFPKVIKWIEVNLKDFFFVSDKLYAIETWRIDIMIEKARNELQKYKSNLPMFEVPEKSSYEKQEIMEYIQNMMKSIGFNIEVFELNYRLRSAGKVNFKRSDIYSIYNSCCRCSVMNALNVFHLAHDMQVYHRKNHIEKIVGKDFDKYFEMLYNFQTSESRQSNNVSEIMKKRFEKEKEKEEMIENMKIENLELKKNMEDLRRQLENMKNEAENKRKIFHKEISRKNEENLKIAENLSILKRELKHVNNELKNTQEKCSQIVEEFKKEITMKDQQWERINRKNSEKKRFIISLENELKELKAQTSSTKELKEVKKELKGLQGTYSNLREESRKNIEKLKEENRKMKENRENEKNKYEKSLKLREKENMEISGKLQKSVENSEKLNSIIKNLEKDLRNSKIDSANNLKVAETSQKLENENKNLKNQLEQLFDEKVGENGKIEELSKENKKLREKLANNSRKMKKFEEWFENGIEKMRRTSKNREKLRKYERILKIDYETIIDEISSKLNELIRKFPENSEFLCARNEIEEFDENLENYMENIREEIRKIERNLEGEYEENEDIQEFPNQEFMQKYQEWVEKYL